MAEEIERLLVVLEARTKAFETNLNRANQVADRRLRAVEKRFADANTRINKSMAGLGGSLSGGALAGGLAGGFGARQIVEYADAWTSAGNKIAAASQVAGRQGRSLSAMNDIAKETRSGIVETVDLYAKLLRSTAGVAKSEEDVARATEIVNKAFKAGGASASEQAAGIGQLAQALGSGVLQGDELRSIRENAPLLAQAIADEFKTTIGGLKELGADGELEVGRVFQAILSGGDKVERAFLATSATVGDGFGQLNNILIESAGRINDVTGLTGKAGEGLQTLATIVENLASVFEAASGNPVVGFIGKLNEMIGKLDPLTRGLRALSDADAMAGLAGGLTPKAEGIVGIIAKLNGEFDAFRGGLKAMKPDAVAAFDALQKGLNDGTVSAEEAKVAVSGIVDGSPNLAEIKRKLDPLLDGLKAIEEQATVTTTAVAAIADPDGNRGAGGEYIQKRTAFLNDRMADVAKTDVQREIESKTDDIIEAADKVGVAIDRAAARIQATKEVIGAKVMDSRGGVLDDYVSQVVGAESGGKTDAKNPLSSATGLGQFIESTWVRLFKQTFPEMAGQSREAILELRKDGEISKQMIREYARENSQVLRAAGVSVDAAALHLAHFLGPQGAAKILKADPNALAATVLGAAAAKANPTIIGNGHTAGDVVAYGQKRAGMSTAGTEALDKRVEGQEAYKATLDTIKERIALLNAESTAQAGLNPKVDDYGFAVEKARITQELLNDAQSNGIAVTPALRAEIGQLATDYATAAVAGDKLKAGQEALADSQEVLAQKLADSSAFGKDVLGGFIRDLRDGKSATEALAGALDKVADKLLDMALNSLFDGAGKPGAGGGILGGLFGMLGFAKGGYTGHGGKHQPAGVVHKGEYVFSKSATQRLGAGNLERLHRGYAAGGMVGPAPGIPNVTRTGGDGVANVRVFVDQDGNWQAKVESISQRTASQVTRQGIGQYDNQLNRAIGGKMARAQARQL